MCLLFRIDTYILFKLEIIKSIGVLNLKMIPYIDITRNVQKYYYIYSQRILCAYIKLTYYFVRQIPIW